MKGVKAVEKTGSDDALAYGHEACDAEVTQCISAEPKTRASERLHGRIDWLGMGQEVLSLLCQPVAAALFLDQRMAERCLQRAQPTSNGRLIDPERSCRRAQAAGARDRKKVA
jgi:hypothetical protein